MSLWIRRGRYEMYAEASAPGIWMLKGGGYYVKTRSHTTILRGAKLEEAMAVHQQLKQGRTVHRFPTFEKFALDLLQEKIDKKQITSAATRERWIGVLSRHLVPAFGPKRIDTLVHLDVVEWQNKIAKDESLAASTKNTWLRILKTITAVSTVRFGISKDPCVGVEYLPETCAYSFEQPNALEPTVVADFLRRAKEIFPEYYAMIYLGFVTGRRPGELRAIDREKDVLWDENMILIRRSHSRGQVVRNGTKTGNDVVLCVPEDVMDVLRDHAATTEGPLLFPGKDGKVMCRNALGRAFKALVEEMKLRFKVTPRAMRRSFQDLTRQAGVGDLVTRSISGHTTEKMQFHYSTVGEAEQRAALSRVTEMLK